MPWRAKLHAFLCQAPFSLQGLMVLLGLRDVFEAHVQGADRRRVLVSRALTVGIPSTQQRQELLGELPAEQKVNAGVCAAVQAG